MPVNQFVSTTRHINTVLYGIDGMEHGHGMIEGKILSELHLLKRNERYYYFSRIAGPNTAYFRECQGPYTITEF